MKILDEKSDRKCWLCRDTPPAGRQFPDQEIAVHFSRETEWIHHGFLGEASNFKGHIREHACLAESKSSPHSEAEAPILEEATMGNTPRATLDINKLNAFIEQFVSDLGTEIISPLDEGGCRPQVS